MTGGIIPQCSTCNDLGKDPNGCPNCGTLGPVGRKIAKDHRAKGGHKPKKPPRR